MPENPPDLIAEIERLRDSAVTWFDVARKVGAERDSLSTALGRACKQVSDQQSEIERLKLEAGTLRMCVNCGKVVPADAVGRGDGLPECEHPEYPGIFACTFDMTPVEAFLHWRAKAHEEQRRAADLELDRRALLNAAEQLRGAVTASCEMGAAVTKEKFVLRQRVSALERILADVIGELEHEGSDGWMTGYVAAEDYRAAKKILSDKET